MRHKLTYIIRNLSIMQSIGTSNENKIDKSNMKIETRKPKIIFVLGGKPA